MHPSPKELVSVQIQHHETGAMPYTLDFEGDVATRLDAYYGSPAWRSRIDDAIRHISNPATTLLYMDETAFPQTTDMYGTTWRLDRRPFHLHGTGA